MFTGNEVGTCVSLTHTHPKGLWQNLNCTEQHHFVCQYPRQGYTTPQITTAAASLPCPPSYSGNQSYCYKVQDERIGDQCINEEYNHFTI